MQLVARAYKRPQSMFGILSLLVFCFGNQAYSQDAAQEPIDVIEKFGRELYVTAERTGGSPKEWDLLEEKAATAMSAALQEMERSTKAVDDIGQTALHLASRNGYLSLVELILRSNLSPNEINATDKNGLTAYQHAALALPETLMACHPEIENPFVLVPFIVKLPYYVDRKPFQQILRLLAQAGADQSIEHARTWWLTNCSNQDATRRAEVESSSNLYKSLSEISLAIENENRRRDIEEQVGFLIKLTKLMPKNKRPTPEELQEQIEQMYRDEGLSPPN